VTELKKTVLISLMLLCLLFAPVLIGYRNPVSADLDVIYVPKDYPTIQEAIGHADSGDTIFVNTGTYYENLIVNKSVSLIAEDSDSAIIDGRANGSVISVTANNVNINGFTVRNSGLVDLDSGIYINSSGNNIIHNTITDNKNGIYLYYSSGNVISDNNAFSNGWYGIYLYYSNNNMISWNNASSNYNDGINLYCSNNNTIGNNKAYSNNNGIYLYYSSNNMIADNNVSNNDSGIWIRQLSNNNMIADNDSGIWIRQLSNNNMIADNDLSNNEYGIYLYYSSNNIIVNNNAYSNNNHGIYLYYSSNNNTIYHNNIIGNIDQVWSDSVNVWDYDGEGNYWSDYTGQDLDGDGIGDNPYVVDVNNRDSHPLMGTFSDFKVAWKGRTHCVSTTCSSTISDFRFEILRETGNKMIGLDVRGEDGSVGFCRVMIPTELMNYSYIVLVDGEEITPTVLDISDNVHAYLYFTYVHSNHTIRIISSRLLYFYNELVGQHVKLEMEFHSLNSTLLELLDNYSALLSDYSQLLERYSTLNASYQEHLLDYSELQRNHTSILLEQTQNIRNLTYVFIATTTIFIIAAVYISTHAHRSTPRR